MDGHLPLMVVEGCAEIDQHRLTCLLVCSLVRDHVLCKQGCMPILMACACLVLRFSCLVFVFNHSCDPDLSTSIIYCVYMMWKGQRIEIALRPCVAAFVPRNMQPSFEPLSKTNFTGRRGQANE